MSPHEPNEESILEEALALGSIEARGAYLRGACGNDEALRGRVESLIEAHQEAGGFLRDKPNRENSSAHAQNLSGESAGAVIDRYKLLEKIGEGGCGVVYVAEQTEPVRRRVALKVIKLGMDTRAVVARFEAERQALAMMDHPNIAKVLDAGTTGTGRPYFVMELVRGIRITDYCDQASLSTKERLGLFIKVCQAIQHAHQKGVIHRDIKPSNILVTLHDGVPVPKVIDFGIAKATEGRLTDATVYTQLHQFIGTPAYMSPEQAEMSGLDIDTRSDIYSLGVLLYELLIGRTPFDAKELVDSGLDAMRKTIREKEPLRPSTRFATLRGDELTTAARRRSAEAPKLVHLLKGDLDAIVMKCLEKDRSRRYETANGLAADIQRQMRNEPVAARPPSAAYRFQKAFRRNKVAFVAGATVAAALLIGIVVSAWQAVRATKAEREQAKLREAAVTAKTLAEQAEARETAERRRAEAQELVARQRAYAADMNLAQQAIAVSNTGRAQILLNRHRPQPGQRDLRRWEWRYLWQLCQSDAVFELPPQPSILCAADFSPDGKLLATADLNGTVKLWDFNHRREIQTLSQRGDLLTPLAFSPSGKLFAMSTSPDDGPHFASILNIATGQTIIDLPHTNSVLSLAFTPDEKRLITWEKGRNVLVWDLEKKRPVFQFPAPRMDVGHGGAVAISPDGRLLAMGGPREARGIDLATGAIKFTVSNLGGEVTALAFSPEAGGPLAIGTSVSDGAIRLFDPASGNPTGRLIGHNALVLSLRFTKDGKRLVSTSGDHTVRVWDVPSRSALLTLNGQLAPVWCVALTPDGQSAVSGGKDGSILCWDLGRPPREDTFAILPEPLSSVEFSADSRFFFGVKTNGAVSMWDTRSLRELGPVTAAGTNVTRVLSSRDGRLLVVGTSRGGFKVLNGATRLAVTNLPDGAAAVVPVGFLSRETTLVTVDDDGVINQWDTASWRLRASARFPGKVRARDSALVDAPNTGFLLLCPEGREQRGWLSWWNLSKSKEEASFQTDKNYASEPAVSPDGQLVAAPGTEPEMKLWNAATRAQVGVLRGHLQGASSAAFSPDGDRVASGSTGRETVRLWDVATQHDLGTLGSSESTVVFIRFSPDGNLIVAIDVDGQANLWRAPSWEEIGAAEADGKRPVPSAPAQGP
jgi:WD40 repeat protein/serine/threonine protein kinase